jgi:hypothetical protein
MLVKLSFIGERQSVASPSMRTAMLPEKDYTAIPQVVMDMEKGGFAKIPYRSVKSYLKRNTIPGLRLPGRI